MSAGYLMLFDWTCGVGVNTDEVGFRYLLQVAAEDGEPFHVAVRSRFARYWS